MKDTKRRIMTFTFYDRSGIERDLEAQAAKGWMLETCSAAGWIYRRIEPAKIHFSVVYFPAASAFDPHPSEHQQRFQEFCEHTGWELIASNLQMQIFCNRRENPIPIETDPEIELGNIHASVKKTVLPTYCMDVVLGFVQLGLAFQRFSQDPIGELANLTAPISILFWILMIFSCGTQILLYYRWHYQAKAAARDGHFLETRSTDRFQITMMVSTSLALLFMFLSLGGIHMALIAGLLVVLIVGTSLLTVRLTNYLKTKNVSAKVNRAITYAILIPASLLICGVVIWLMVSVQLDASDRRDEAETYEYNGWTYYVYHDTLPLRIEDLIDTDYEGYSYEVTSDKGSPFLHRYEARQKTRYDALAEPEMHYHVIQIKVPFLYDFVLNQMKAEFDHGHGYPEDDPNWEEHREIAPTPWGAKKAYQLILGGEPHYRYLLCYENAMIEIDLDWEPTAEHMASIPQKLLP